MKTLFFTLICFGYSFLGYSQSKILVFHETNQFRQGSITSGIDMFENLGNENNEWITDNSQDSSVFTDANLQQYDAVVFLNTSGSDETGSDGDLLTSSEKLALENFIANGKGFIGVHAATDTYRDGSWPFYNELVGGIVQTNPNHTSNNYNADLVVLADNIIIDFLGPVGSIWNKNEEYYYWEQNGGQLSATNIVLLEVEQTGNETYDAARPIAWFKESMTYDDDNDNSTANITLTGFRSFYTALGHNNSDYESNTNFRTMLKNATLWAIGQETLNVTGQDIENFKLFPNPVEHVVNITVANSALVTSITVYNELGQQIMHKKINTTPVTKPYALDISALDQGIYILKLMHDNKNSYFKFIKK
ncbi:MAG: ThuA domain-containing protein [Psychroserpens sp.]|uniref:ThuA domain-containing protein n=1 Tax=Psychroserpens sp. TaxID=2020870 RepID=UPI003C745D10